MKVKDGCRVRVRRKVGVLEEEEVWKLWKIGGETGEGLKCECVGMYSTMCSVFIYIWNSRWPIELKKEWVIHSGTCQWLITAVTCFYPKACVMSPSLWYTTKAACLIGTWAILLHSLILTSSTWKLIWAACWCSGNPVTSQEEGLHMLPVSAWVLSGFFPQSKDSHLGPIIGQFAALSWPYVFVSVC